MKKLYAVKEAVYSPAKEETQTVENVETLAEHIETEKMEKTINILINENKMNDDCDSMKVVVEREDFKSLFGPNSKPRKGDVVSITGLASRFKVKKYKKFTAKKKGAGYKLNLQKV